MEGSDAIARAPNSVGGVGGDALATVRREQRLEDGAASQAEADRSRPSDDILRFVAVGLRDVLPQMFMARPTAALLDSAIFGGSAIIPVFALAAGAAGCDPFVLGVRPEWLGVPMHVRGPN